MADRLRLDRGPEAPAAARTAVSKWLGRDVDRHVLEDVKLLVSELVTNAVRHQSEQGPIELELSRRRGSVRVEVADPGSGFHKPKVGEPLPDALGGRGLLIVERVAARWGVTPGRPTRVWFELDAA
jgi:anti-sigma regulatory factor (Ser/Thr protein kinase)